MRLGVDLVFVLFGNVPVDMKESRVLKRDRIMQHKSEQDDQHEEPGCIDAILVGAHEVRCQIHGLEVEQGERIHDSVLDASEVSQSVAPDRIDDQRHQEQHHDIKHDQVPQVNACLRNQAQQDGNPATDGRELEDHQHVHQHEVSVVDLRHLVQICQLFDGKHRFCPQQLVHCAELLRQDDEVDEVDHVEEVDGGVPSDLAVLGKCSTDTVQFQQHSNVDKVLIPEVQAVESQFHRIEDENGYF